MLKVAIKGNHEKMYFWKMYEFSKKFRILKKFVLSALVICIPCKFSYDYYYILDLKSSYWVLKNGNNTFNIVFEKLFLRRIKELVLRSILEI